MKTKINAPIDRVWETVMDPERLKDWVTIHRSVKDVSAQPLRQGSTMDQVLHMRGVSFRVHWKLADVKAPNRAEWEGQGPAHSRARIIYELSSNGDDATAVRVQQRVLTAGRQARQYGQPGDCGCRLRARGPEFTRSA